MTGIETKVDDLGLKRVSAVQTPSGTIKTNSVVNCTGVWAPNVGALCGVTVPLVAMYHAYIVTERIEGIQNMPNVRDHDASVYLKLQGDGLSVGGYENNPIFWDEVRAIDLFTDTAAILKLLDLRSIMGYPGDPCSVFTHAFRAKRELHCAFLGEKAIIITAKRGTTIFFSHYNLFLGKHKEKLARKARK